MKFCCEICGTPLGYVDREKIDVPMTGDMFLPLMPGRNLPPPFQSGRAWELLYCRQCKSRAFHTRDHVMLLYEDGSKELKHVDDLKLKYKCECGKEYQHESSLIRHRKDCEWQKKTA
jgi:hypothetical protein